MIASRISLQGLRQRKRSLPAFGTCISCFRCSSDLTLEQALAAHPLQGPPPGIRTSHCSSLCATNTVCHDLICLLSVHYLLPPQCKLYEGRSFTESILFTAVFFVSSRHIVGAQQKVNIQRMYVWESFMGRGNSQSA